MAATREEFIARSRLANSALQLHQPQAEEKANGQALELNLTQENQLPQAADKVKKIILPGPFTEKKEEDDIRTNGIPGFDQVIPHEIQDIILSKLYAEEEKKEEAAAPAPSSKSPQYEYLHLSFFSKNVAQFEYWLRKAADDILDGSQAKVDRVIAQITQHPSLLQYRTEGRDRLGRCVKGTLLQIAAMAGEVNIRELKEEEKQYRGIVELLTEAGQLSNEDVAKQLHPVLFSQDAIKVNAERMERILAAVKQLGESIIQAGIAEQPAQLSEAVLQAAQKKCWPAIKIFRETLKATFHDVIESGYVFDTSILHQAMAWFEQKNNLDRFGGWWTPASEVFWVNGIGSLQCIVSSRDAQVCRKGIGYVVDHHQMPERGLKKYGACDFSLDSSRLGLEFFLGHFGARVYADVCGEGKGTLASIVNLVSRKNSSAEKFMQRQNKPRASRCVIQ